MRVESDRPHESGGWLHRLDRFSRPTVQRAKKESRQPVWYFYELAMEYRANIKRLDLLAQSFGVSESSLNRLEVGFDGTNYSFPMRDASENIIGIHLRGPKGRFAVKGSRNGIFWPLDVLKISSKSLYICEGATDCAALLDLGFNTIGRPSCTGAVGYVKAFLRRTWRDVIIFADNDVPGIEGAFRLARQIKGLCRGVKVITPPRHKDIREWVQAGATSSAVEAVIQNTKFIRKDTNQVTINKALPLKKTILVR